MGQRLPANNRRSSCPDKKANRNKFLFAKSNTTELVKMTSTATSERSGRIPDLKTTTSVSSSTSSATPTGTQESSLLVSKHPLLCSLLSSPSPQQLVVTPRRQQSQEVGVGGGWRSPE